MSLPPLRIYQKKVKQNFKAIDPTHTLYSIKAPTGSGKTRMFKECTEVFPDENFAMVMPRINLAHQTLKGNPSWGLVQGSTAIRPNARVVLFTLKTLLNRINSGRIAMDRFKFIFIDEAHIEATKDNPKDKTLKTLGRLMKQARALGVVFIAMSATLYDAKGKDLELWDGAKDLMPKEWLDINHFISSGFLNPLRYKVVGSAPLDLIMGKSDFTADSVKKVIEEDTIDIVGVTMKERLGSTIVLASSISHAEGLYRDFKSRGVTVGILHSKSSDKEVLQKFDKGIIEFIISVNMMTTGTDVPIARTLVIARPIGSQSLFRQAIGRVLRLYAGKPFSLIIDCFDSIGLCDGHPLLPPPSPNMTVVKKDSKPCKECDTKKPLAVTDIKIDISKYVQYTTKVCVNPSCGNVTVVEKQVETVTCTHCNEVQIMNEPYSSNGSAVCLCGFCNQEIFLATLEAKELMLTFQNRDEAITTIEEDAKKRLTDEEFLEFSKEFDVFKIYATLEYLSALVNFFGNVTKKYTDSSLIKVINQMKKNNESFNSVSKNNELINRFIKEKVTVNYELISHIETVTNGELSTQRAICTRIFSAWIKKDDIANTKKYKNNIKRFMTYLKKIKGES